jgi:tryptophanyl-tRNA synthetase
VALQENYESIYCIVDYHALTSVHDGERLRRQTREMAAALIALGLDPNKCTLFVQSHRPEVLELAWILMTVTPVSWVERTPTYKEKKASQPDDVNHGLLTYPILQAADILLPKASVVPVGKDQAAHLELSREIARSFNHKFGETFPEPTAVFTEAPVVLGTDGEKKMSKSVNNTIDILSDAETIKKQVMSAVTDTKRPLKSDPGHPEACNVCQLHKLVNPDYKELWESERNATTGCADLKRALAERLTAHYAPARERYQELLALPHEINNILGDGAQRLLPLVTETMREVKERVGLA